MENSTRMMSKIQPYPYEKRPIIIVIDSDPNFKRDIEESLAKYCFRQFFTIEQSVQIILAYSPATTLVIVNHDDNIDGLKILTEVKDLLIDLPVLLWSEQSDIEDPDYRFGADCFLKKPVSSEQLQNVIETLITEAH